jgi:hypothetical protein
MAMVVDLPQQESLVSKKNVLIVTLDTEANPPCLNVADEHGANQVAQGPDWQTIRWKLEVDGSDASFNPQKDAKPGFAWVGVNRPAGIFSEPLRRNRKVLVMAVLNDNKASGDGDNTTGEWIYQLSATIDKVPYQRRLITGVRTTTNPRIKNTWATLHAGSRSRRTRRVPGMGTAGHAAATSTTTTGEHHVNHRQ